VWIRDRYTISADADGRPLMVQGVMEDVTALRAAENRFREVLDDINLLAVTLDRGGRVVFANDHFLATMGRRRDEVVGQDWFGLFAPMEERDLRRQSYAHAMETGMIPRHGELRLLTADGGVRLIRYNHTLVMGDDGKPAQLTSIAEDITDRRRAEDEVHRLAHYDPLTGLPNRTMFSKDLDEAIRCSVRLGRTVGVMFVSLDDFTLVNDSLGPAAGDALLRQFTARLEEAASIAATVARQGGDEFLVLLADCDPSPDSETHLVAEDVAQMAGAIDNRLQRLLRKPFCHDGTDIYLSATSGWRCARATPPRATPC
jgi:diguanylate cyclase (GGDEF)-like protein